MNGSDYIRVYQGVIPEEECDRMVAFYDTYPDLVSAGLTSKGLTTKVKVSLDMYFEEIERFFPEEYDFLHLVKERLRGVVDMYADELGFVKDVAKFYLFEDAPKLKRYVKNIGLYKTHSDSGPSVPDRQFVVLAYLNDVEEGGETLFPLQDVQVKPRKGDVLIFPPMWTYPHSANVPVSNDKYILSAFYHPKEAGGHHGRT